MQNSSQLTVDSRYIDSLPIPIPIPFPFPPHKSNHRRTLRSLHWNDPMSFRTNPFQNVPSKSIGSEVQTNPSTSVNVNDGGGPKQPTGATLKNLSEEKLVSFAIGSQKKSRFQKAREEQEAKRKQDEEEAAKVYKSFVQSFQEDDDDEEEGFDQRGSKKFVRGGAGGGRGNGDVYRMSQNSSAGKSSKNSEMDKLMQEMKTSSSTSKEPTSWQAEKKPKREMDMLFEEIKNKHEGGGPGGESGLFGSLTEEEISFYGLDRGSFDNGDPHTTNLYIGNLNPTTTEEELVKLFGRYGEINSVKVMWPRSDEERLKKKNNGFVSFKDRRDATEAMIELNETMYKDYKMVICWGKAVKIRDTPFIPPKPPAHLQITNQLMGSRSSNNSSSTSDPSAFAPPPPPLPMAFPSEVEMGRNDPAVTIHFPKDPRKQQVIDLLASYVATDGEMFEKIIKANEEQGPESKRGGLFDYLFQVDTDDAHYYRWRTYANIVGETAQSWREKPFQYSRDGMFVIPPPAPVKTSQPPSSLSKFTPSNPPSSSQRPRSESFASRRSSSPANRRKGERRSPSPSPPSQEGRNKRGRSRSSPSYSSYSSEEERGGGKGRRNQRGRSRSPSPRNQSKYAGMTGAQIERAREKNRQQSKYSSLHKRDLTQFLELLSSLDLSRQSIKVVMGFAFDKIECAEEMISLIKKKLILPRSLSAAVKIAALFLLSDILHNSATPIPGATNFRLLIQNQLPEVFEEMGFLFRNTLGRMSAHNIEDRVKRVLSAWKEWSIFPLTYLAGLEAMFYLTESEYQELRTQIQTTIAEKRDEDKLTDAEYEALRKKAKQHGVYCSREEDEDDGDDRGCVVEMKMKIAVVERYLQKKYNVLEANTTSYFGLAAMEAEAQVDKEPVAASHVTGEEGRDEQVDGKEVDDDVDGVPVDDLDGVPLEDDVDGVPMDDVDGVPMDDVDGMPIDDVDGVPLDDDIDGVPLDNKIDDIDGQPL